MNLENSDLAVSINWRGPFECVSTVPVEGLGLIQGSVESS